MKSLSELIGELRQKKIGEQTFNAIIEELEKLPKGKGLMALRSVATANVDDGSGRYAREELFIRTCSVVFPIDHRYEVINSLAMGWEEMSEENLLGNFRSLSHLLCLPRHWNLRSIEAQMTTFVERNDCSQSGVIARSILDCIRDSLHDAF